MFKYLCWVPAFTGQLATLGVIDWGVEDRDTEVPILIDIGMPDLGEEADGWRGVWVVRWELDMCLRRRRKLVRERKVAKKI